jgi:soluble lytic murein transglycosylase-like protein
MDLTTNDARVALAAKWAPKYGLNPYIVCAVCEQESAWNPFAVRFEPAFEARYIRPALPAAPTTRELTEAISFGLMQVMGEVAIECGWAGKFLTELCDPDTGVDFGCRKLQKCFAAHPNPEQALLAYNGGGNQFYGKQVLARVTHYEPQQGAD